jgi:hypothetical protein
MAKAKAQPKHAGGRPSDYGPHIITETKTYLEECFDTLTEKLDAVDEEREITSIHKITMREIGEKHGIEFIPFPNDGACQLKEIGGLQDLRRNDGYSRDGRDELRRQVLTYGGHT